MAREYSTSEARAEAGRKGGLARSKSLASSSSKTIAPSASLLCITYSSSSLKWEGIKEEDIESWKSAYPACDIDLELKRMVEWLKSNPAKARKSNYRKFITGWLSRTQDRGGTRGILLDPTMGEDGKKLTPSERIEKWEKENADKKRF
jgi:hypothetical protein